MQGHLSPRPTWIVTTTPFSDLWLYQHNLRSGSGGEDSEHSFSDGKCLRDSPGCSTCWWMWLPPIARMLHARCSNRCTLMRPSSLLCRIPQPLGQAIHCWLSVSLSTLPRQVSVSSCCVHAGPILSSGIPLKHSPRNGAFIYCSGSSVEVERTQDTCVQASSMLPNGQKPFLC